MSNSTSNPGCLAAIKNLFQSNGPSITVVDYPPDPGYEEDLPYRTRDDFLSPAEHSFYLVIKQMMGIYLTVCPKVSLADIFFVVHPNENMSAFNKINRKHVDFLICEPKTMKPKFAIELDDSSHQRADRMERDEFVDRVFETAGLSLIHVPVRNVYDTTELGILFKKVLQPVSELLQDEHIEAKAATPSNEPPVQEKKVKNPPNCPKCGVPMVLRVAKTGENAGKKFYGCPNYPKCRQVKPFEN